MASHSRKSLLSTLTRRQGESQDSDSSLHQNQNEALQGVKLAQETLTALQAKRAELTTGPSPSPRKSSLISKAGGFHMLSSPLSSPSPRQKAEAEKKQRE